MFLIKKFRVKSVLILQFFLFFKKNFGYLNLEKKNTVLVSDVYYLGTENGFFTKHYFNFPNLIFWY